MTINYTPASLVTLEKDNIHFDTLMGEAHAVIDGLSGAVWTDTAIHDPGITLLESLAWNISDLSYRCLLPLQDLLTPAEATPGDGLFPPGFMPEQMLTTSPITLDDYRRGILDLYSPAANAVQGYYFSDATITKQKDDKRYKTFYDKANRQFVFNKVDESSNYTALYLNGGYEVQARRAFLPAVDSQVLAKGKLDDYLDQNRNLCEVFRKITVIDAGTPVPLTITVELNDSLEDINDFYAKLYIILHQSLALPVAREAEINLAEGSYTGPRAEHGWIPTLPVSDFGTGKQTVSVGQFIVPISAMPEVEAIRYISLDEKTLLLYLKEKADQQYILWSNDSPLAKRIDAMLKHVSLYRHEIKLTPNSDEILKKLQQRLLPQPSTPGESLPVGRYRNLSRYYPASSLVPPLYNLQDWSPDGQTQQLHRFMLGFEQVLASHADGLERLCRLLNFSLNDSIEQPVYGSQWPFASDTPYDEAHREIKDLLTGQDALNQDSRGAELALVRFLLAYFGIESVDLPSSTDPRLDEYLNISHALLQYMPQVGYARTAIHIGQVSSLQRRLAGQLGYGLRLFDSSPDMAKLPFYLVEHPLLLPARPEGALHDDGKVKSARMVTIDDKELLLVELSSDLTEILTAQHMVNLSLPVAKSVKKGTKKAGDGSETLISNLLVMLVGAAMEGVIPPPAGATSAPEIQNNCFFLYPAQFRLLRLRLNEVLAAATANQLVVEFSNVWLNEMSYMLEQSLVEPVDGPVSTDEFNGASWKIRTSDDQPWPAVLREENILILQPVYGNVAGAKESEDAAPAFAPVELQAIVRSVDGLDGSAVIQLAAEGDKLDLDTLRYSWYIDPDSNELLLRDRFSFTLSLVFRRSVITGRVESDSAEDYEREEQRIRRIVQAEVPAHIQTRMLWLSDSQFATFASTYVSWQQNRLAVGEDTLKLLRMLSIGMLSELIEGIGEMIIPRQEIEQALEDLLTANGGIAKYDTWPDSAKEAWQKLIDDNGLLFIPPDQSD